jgi:hypothetical protein
MAVEEILPIVQVEDREAALLLLHILLRQIYLNGTVIRQNLRVECVKLVTRVPGKSIAGVLIAAGHYLAIRRFKRQATRRLT